MLWLGDRAVSRRRLIYLAATALLGVPLSQVGHLLAYFLEYGPAAWQLQQVGVHAYFPLLIRTSVGLIGAAALALTVLFAVVRLLIGRACGLKRSQALPWVDFLVVLVAVQLETYIVQELIESVAAGQAVTIASLLGIVQWGLIGQLPAALLAALAMSWLSVRLDGATAELRNAWSSPRTAPAIPTLSILEIRPPADMAILALERWGRTRKRGPPALL